MSVKKNSINLAMRGAVILTIAGLMTKILSAAYRVPYQNIVGDIGFYIYQQVYPFYGMSVILATSGFPVMISKVMTDYGFEKSIHIRSKILTVSFLFLFLGGLFFSSSLYFYAEDIALYMGDKQLTPLIQVTSCAFMITPLVSIIRGFFQSNQDMEPTALSQVLEQGIRVTIILLSSYYMVNAGYSFYEAGTVAIIGSVVGSMTALIVLIYLWRKRGDSKELKWNLSASIQSKVIILSLLKYSWTIALSSLLLIFIQLIDALNLYSLLVGNGLESELAKETKGIYDRGQPLIQLGTVVATSLALSLVPLIASAKAKNHNQFIQEKINLVVKLCVVVGAGASFGLIGIIKPTNVMLFTNHSGSAVLMVLSCSILFTSLALTIFAILQGLGYVFMPALAVIIGVIAKYYLNQILIAKYGVIGAAASTVIAYMFVSIIVIVYLSKKGFPFKEHKSMAKILIAAMIMLCILVGVVNILGSVYELENRLYATYTTFFSLFLGGGIYILLILKLRVFTKEELQYIPLIKKL